LGYSCIAVVIFATQSIQEMIVTKMV